MGVSERSRSCFSKQSPKHATTLSSDLRSLHASSIRSPIRAVEYCKKHVEAADLLYTAWKQRDSPCRAVRRRVRKTAVSSATLIEEFDSFLAFEACFRNYMR
ncbi:hypothetical protein ACB094_05G026100 [Castanea mollissima]